MWCLLHVLQHWALWKSAWACSLVYLMLPIWEARQALHSDQDRLVDAVLVFFKLWSRWRCVDMLAKHGHEALQWQMQLLISMHALARLLPTRPVRLCGEASSACLQ